MKNAYAVICHRSDCGDETVFQMETYGGTDWWHSIQEARKAMKYSYKRMCEEWSVGSLLRCRHSVKPGEIRLDIPCADENGKESWLCCRWKIVKI